LVVLIVADSRSKVKIEKYFNQARDGVFADKVDLPFKITTANALDASD